jgi:hypothetical protein
MKELELEFIGRGQVKGFIFTQIKKSDYAFIYQVNTGSGIHYEVFKRKENSHFNCVSYPSNKAFGLWAFTYKNLELSIDRFKEMEVING